MTIRPEPDRSIEGYAKELWDYLTIADEPAQADVAFVLGRDDTSVVQEALRLYERRYTSTLILLGGRGRMSGSLTAAEAEVFRDYLLSRGVPSSAILLDTKSSNTTENIREGLKLLPTRTTGAPTILLVTHAPHSRRAMASATFQLPAARFLSCPDACELPRFGSLDYARALTELAGEVDRLVTYPALGYPVEKVAVPADMLRSRGVVGQWVQEWSASHP